MITPAVPKVTNVRPVDRLSWLWLAIGAALLPFTSWQTVLPIAAWLAPVFIIRFARTQRVAVAVPVVVLVSCAAMAVTFRNGVLPAPPSILIPIVAGYGLAGSLGFIADRLLAPRLGGLGRTLIFPLAVTTVDFLQARFNPILGSFGSPAYSQAGNLPLLQVVSLTGLWGLTFLISWLAPVANAVWEHGGDWRAVRGSAGAFAATLLAVLLFGSGRLAFFPPASPAVRVAGLGAGRERYRAVTPDPFRLTPGTAAERAAVGAQFAPPLDALFAHTQQAARAGARIVVWSEDAALVLQEDVPAVIERAGTVARQENIYLQIGLLVFRDTDHFPFDENRAVLVDPTGAVLWDYQKTFPTPGPETFRMQRGGGLLPTAQTPFGRLATAICFDMDIPTLLRQVGQADADVLLAGYLEWEQVRFTHAGMATFRAIENGASLVRPTGEGISTAVDYQGRVLASVDYLASEDPMLVTMLAAVPTKGAGTIYARIGDAFAYLSVAGLALLIILALLPRRVGVIADTSTKTAGARRPAVAGAP